MSEIKPIKLPVTYDQGLYSNPFIRDAEGRVVAEIAAWQYNWPAQGGKPDDEIQPENGHAVGEQIAAALNEDGITVDTLLRWLAAETVKRSRSGELGVQEIANMHGMITDALTLFEGRDNKDLPEPASAQ